MEGHCGSVTVAEGVATKVFHPHNSAAKNRAARCAELVLSEVERDDFMPRRPHPRRLWAIEMPAASCDLLEYIERLHTKGGDVHATAESVATHCLSFLLWLHNLGCAHRDLKAENFLLHEGRPLLSDFDALYVPGASDTDAGFCRCESACRVPHYAHGTPAYVPPEWYTKLPERRDPRAGDVWALGVVVFMVLHGKMPWVRPRAGDAWFDMWERRPEEFARARDMHGDGLWPRFLRSTLTVDEAARPTVAQLLEEFPELRKKIDATPHLSTVVENEESAHIGLLTLQKRWAQLLDDTRRRDIRLPVPIHIDGEIFPRCSENAEADEEEDEERRNNATPLSPSMFEERCVPERAEVMTPTHVCESSMYK